MRKININLLFLLSMNFLIFIGCGLGNHTNNSIDNDKDSEIGEGRPRNPVDIQRPRFEDPRHPQNPTPRNNPGTEPKPEPAAKTKPDAKTETKTTETNLIDTSKPASVITKLPNIDPANLNKWTAVGKQETVSDTVPATTTIIATRTFGTKILRVVQGDIVKEPVDAIVNGANSGLEGGGGVDGAIHSAAGPELAKYNKAYKIKAGISGLDAGSAMISPAFNMKQIKYVVAAVGPQDDVAGNNEILYSTIYRSLEKAGEHKAKSVSIPAVSTGIYKFPLERGAKIIAIAAIQYFKDYPATTIDEIRFTNTFDSLHPKEGTTKVFAMLFKQWDFDLTKSLPVYKND